MGFSSTDFGLKLSCQPATQVICMIYTNDLKLVAGCIVRFAVEIPRLREKRKKEF